MASTDFKYGDSILAVGATGLVWDVDLIVPYLTDPKGWLVEKTGDAGAKSKMTFKLSKKGEDVAAYLAVSPAPEAGADDAAEDDGESEGEEHRRLAGSDVARAKILTMGAAIFPPRVAISDCRSAVAN